MQVQIWGYFFISPWEQSDTDMSAAHLPREVGVSRPRPVETDVRSDMNCQAWDCHERIVVKDQSVSMFAKATKMPSAYVSI